MVPSVVFVALSLFLFSFCSVRGERSWADKIAGEWVMWNLTDWNGTNWNQALDLNGVIIYTPAYPGALYGNMSVSYTTISPSLITSTMDYAAAVSSYSSYFGAYQLYPSLGYVTHTITQNNNPYNTSRSQRGAVNVRYVVFDNNDNNLTITSTVPPTSYLHWTRPFPTRTADCTASVTLVARSGSSWTASDGFHQVYDVSVINTGSATITSLTVNIIFSSTSSIGSYWNLQNVGTSDQSIYSVSLFGGLAAGATSTSSGFIANGSGSITGVLSQLSC